MIRAILSTLTELFAFMWANKIWWMAPVVVDQFNVAQHFRKIFPASRGKIIHHTDGVAPIEQRPHQMGADKSSSPRYERSCHPHHPPGIISSLSRQRRLPAAPRGRLPA